MCVQWNWKYNHFFIIVIESCTNDMNRNFCSSRELLRKKLKINKLILDAFPVMRLLLMNFIQSQRFYSPIENWKLFFKHVASSMTLWLNLSLKSVVYKFSSYWLYSKVHRNIIARNDYRKKREKQKIYHKTNGNCPFCYRILEFQEMEWQYENVSYKLENYGNFQNVHEYFFFVLKV